MKSVIIDRSLVDMKLCGDAQKRMMYMYGSSLNQAGADYVELGLNALVKLPKPTFSDNYIYRLNAAEEYVVANAFDFAYVVVPLRYSYIISKITRPVILEIDIDGTDILEAVQILSVNLDFSSLGMLRLVGDFIPEEIPEIIAKCRRRIVLPIDICPKNTTLSALSSAISAYKANSDSITLSFGNDREFASLEEFLVMMAAIHRIVVHHDYLEGICRAELTSALITEEKHETNLSVMMRKYLYCPTEIENADGVINVKSVRPLPFRKQTKHISAAQRVLSSLGVERDLSDKITEVLEGCGMEISGKQTDTDNTELQ
ncbi:MAG: hypothetical protein FWD34_06080 [Oscillospiraceae bacterium]|nr:hypothetical protein [Oscillospiraceae bacterium]